MRVAPLSMKPMSTPAKQRQAAKIAELVEALTTAGYINLDDRADHLGLHRSTMWTIVSGRHKGSGLTKSLVDRMLASDLHPNVRRIILEYVEERVAGLYGHGRRSRRWGKMDGRDCRVC